MTKYTEMFLEKLLTYRFERIFLRSKPLIVPAEVVKAQENVSFKAFGEIERTMLLLRFAIGGLVA